MIYLGQCYQRDSFSLLGVTYIAVSRGNTRWRCHEEVLAAEQTL